MFTIFPWVYVRLFYCFKQPPLNFSLILLPRYSINGERLPSDGEGGLILSSDNSLDFYYEIYFVLAITLKYLYVGWNPK